MRISKSVFMIGMLAGTLIVPKAYSAVSLTRGTETHLTGSLGDVQVNYVSDNVSLIDYLDSSGLVLNAPTPVEGVRVQYDMKNTLGNEAIFEFTVNYQPGATVLGAADPEGFYDDLGNVETYWGGLAYFEVFDNGYGIYDYDSADGSEWQIDYQADHVTWINTNDHGFLPDTASGETNYGFNSTFALLFAPGTQLGMQDAMVVNTETTSSGQVLSAVPIPAAGWLFVSGLMGLGIFKRRR